MRESTEQPAAGGVQPAGQRRPSVVALGASAAILWVWESIRQIPDAPGTRSWLNWFVVGFTASAVVVVMFFVPRVLEPQFHRRGRVEQVVGTRFAFALAPAAVGIVTSGAGADGWASATAVSASVALLFVAARATESSLRADRAGPTV